jgi:hypothetical protein
MKPQTGSKHFTSKLDYSVSGNTAIVEIKEKIDLRKVDPWALCYKEWLECEHQIHVNSIQLIILHNVKYKTSEIEAFIRRISFLNIVNPTIRFDVIVSDDNVKLLDIHSLINRPTNEIIHQEIGKRDGKDKPGKLEKDFQVFLFGGTILSENMTPKNYTEIYNRLGVLGVDFYQLKNSYKVLREFPIGAFSNTVSEKDRILPTNFIDIVSFNKRKELAVIELKLNDPKIEVISQLLDYALFFRAYKPQIVNLIKDNLCPANFEKKPIACYVANNHFHPRLKGIIKYYATDAKKFGFSLNMITLGVTRAIWD